MPIIRTGTFDTNAAANILAASGIKPERNGQSLAIHDGEEYLRAQLIIDEHEQSLRASCGNAADSVRELFGDAKKSEQAWRARIMQTNALGDECFETPRECLHCGEWVGGTESDDDDRETPADDLRFCSEECRTAHLTGRQPVVAPIVVSALQAVKNTAAAVLDIASNLIERTAKTAAAVKDLLSARRARKS